MAGVDMPADHEVSQLRDGHDESSVGLSLATVFSGDSYNLMSGVDATATSSTGEGSLAKGKKRATSAEKESAGSGADGGASSNASRDAHLFMAVTQAINVLISFFKKQEDGRADIKVEDDKTLGKNGAILLAAFSHYLLKALICDRITMETITKASCGSSSSSSSPPNISQFYHSAPSAVGSMNVTSDFGGLGSISRTGAFCPSIDSIDAADPFEEADATRGKRGGGSSSPGKVEQQLRKNRIMSHAKAVVGRGMTSGVMGALWAIETLGNLTSEEDGDFVLEDARKEKSNNNDSDAEEETATAKDVERSLWRKSMWSSLIALETAFQMNTRPKLLTVSAVAASTNTRGVSGGRAGSGMTMMDFDGMVSAASTTMMAGVGRTGAAAGSSGSGRGGLGSGAASSGLGYSSSLAWNHAHSMMGADTIAMWNRLLQRILLDCEIGFHWLKEDENSDKTHESNAQIEENDCLANICQEISGSVFCAQEDALFLSLVLVHHGSIGTIPPPSPSEPPATKKSRRSVSRTRNTKNTGRSDNHEEEFHELSLLLAQRPENHVMFDAHVSVRRWAVLAFSWLCKGQKRLLETCTTIFASSELWESVMELPPFSARTMPTTVPQPSGPMASVTKSKSKKKKKKEKEIRGKRTSPSHIVVLSESQDMSLLGIGTKQLGGLPGNVALVTFVCCMIDMIYDAGSPSGLSPTSGWMDDYVKAVTEIRDSKAELGETTEIVKVEEPAFSEITLTTPSNTGDGPVRRSARTRSKAAAAKSKNEKAATSDTRSSSKGASKKSPNAGTRVWSRPDVRHETAVLTKYLMEAHNRCLANNFRDKLTRENPNIPLSERGSESKRLFMNDDDFSQNSALPARDESNSASASAMTFYPFVHRSLETLGRTAASSSFFASSDAKSRIMAIGSAIALSLLLENFNNYRNNSDGVFVLDAKLYSVAIMQLSDCLESVMLSAKSNEISTVTSSSGNDPLSNQCEIPADVLKEYHLNHPLDIKSQNARDAANSEGSSDHSNISFCSYGGAFPLEADNSNAMDEGVDLALGFRFRRNDSPGFSSPAEIISLFIRAQLTLDGPDTNCKSGMVSLLKSMFAILHSCYDFRPEMHFQGNDQSGDSVTKKKASTGKRKKRKAGEFTSVLESKQPQETRLR